MSMKMTFHTEISSLAKRESSTHGLQEAQEWKRDGYIMPDVANRYVQGESVDDCMRASQFILEESPMPYARMLGDTPGGNPNEEVANADLDDLMSSSLFG